MILNRGRGAVVKNFADLTEREVLAVAISSEEEDSRIYMTFAEDLAERYPESAKIFEEMAEEEKGHRHMLLEMYEQRFGTNLPPIRRDNVRGFLRRRPIWLTKNLSIGAGISMGFAEALSDDGSLTGRGSPWLRGLTCGLMTTVGGLGHTMPYLVPDSWDNAFWIATAIAGVVVFFELWAIAYIRARYMDTPFLQAVFQIVLGGAIVLAVGVLIGAA